jgi:hypothetical protein
MMLYGVSTNGSNELIIQLGTASGFVTSGYNSNSEAVTGTVSQYSSAGFLLQPGNASTYLNSGIVHMIRVDGNNWVYTSNIKRAAVSGTTVSTYGAGDATLGAVLTQVRLTSTNTPDTFDAGTVNIVYES